MGKVGKTKLKISVNCFVLKASIHFSNMSIVPEEINLGPR